MHNCINQSKELLFKFSNTVTPCNIVYVINNERVGLTIKLTTFDKTVT